ncbi:restriction endonuclease [Aerococcus urinaeequi]|uniref:Restriction endonuclease n=1 Tax=Aerococcus urinaeequi TaxID=51665 RepID=A0AA47J390_9LACT|nr:restriction endonuclease [Aerococcus urinaeequi]WAT25345.1 restriction endonuclease [Aerococcus urinaeequi]
MPTWDSFIPYVLEVLKNGEETTRNVIVNRVLDFLEIPEELRIQEYTNSKSSESVLANRIGFALTDLYKANAIIRPKQAVYQITEKGITLLNSYGDKLTTDVLQEQPEYIAYMKELELRNKRSEVIHEVSVEDNLNDNNLDDEENHQEVVEQLINKRNNEVEIELLNKLRETDPIFFEKLVVKLLDAMGYSGKNGNVQVTTQSNDGGIDGIINQDPLGTSTVYLQVKRYAEKNIVGRPAIQEFYGALASVNADRGVFITTSSFSKGALEFARNQGIVLIDGIQLTELMLEYKVGVETAQEYTVYQINYDDFESEE